MKLIQYNYESTANSGPFFKLLLNQNSVNFMLFFMDYEEKNQNLTDKETPTSRLVTVRAVKAVMGGNQSPSFLSLAKQDVAEEIPDKVLQFQIEIMAYVDNCQGGIIAAEIQEVQQSINLDDILQLDRCKDDECCGD